MAGEEFEQLKAQLDRIEQKALLSNKRVLTFKEACIYCDYTKNYMYRLTSKKLIPHSKPHSKTIFFDREKLDEWLLKNPVLTKQEINEKATTYVATHKKQ